MSLDFLAWCNCFSQSFLLFVALPLAKVLFCELSTFPNSFCTARGEKASDFVRAKRWSQSLWLRFQIAFYLSERISRNRPIRDSMVRDNNMTTDIVAGEIAIFQYKSKSIVRLPLSNVTTLFLFWDAGALRKIFCEKSLRLGFISCNLEILCWKLLKL